MVSSSWSLPHVLALYGMRLNSITGNLPGFSKYHLLSVICFRRSKPQKDYSKNPAQGQFSKTNLRKIAITFLSIGLNMCFGCSKEPSRRDDSLEYSQHMLWLSNKKITFLLHPFNNRPVNALKYRNLFYFCSKINFSNSQNTCQNREQRIPWSDCSFRTSLLRVCTVFLDYW